MSEVAALDAAVLAEREACAVFLDKRANRLDRKAGGWTDWPDDALLAKAETTRACAEALRERKQP